MLYADIKTALVDSLLAFTDKMSMAVSLETRVPLLDHRLLELSARIPSQHKLRGINGHKHVFKKAMEGRLPDRILKQRKQGFGTPISRWLRGDLKELVDDVLSVDSICKRGLFRPEKIASMRLEHDQMRADRSEHLVALLMLELWCRKFLDS